MSNTTPTAKHYDEALARLAKIKAAVNDLAEFWTSEDLPGDFLWGETYPFGLELDEQVVQIDVAMENVAALVQDEVE